MWAYGNVVDNCVLGIGCKCEDNIPTKVVLLWVSEL